MQSPEYPVLGLGFGFGLGLDSGSVLALPFPLVSPSSFDTLSISSYALHPDGPNP